MIGTDAMRLAAGLGFALAVAGHAAEDVDGAADPRGYPRYPGAWIVAYAPPTALRSYEFVTGRVDRSGRTVRVDDSMRLPARLVRATYRAPDGTRFDDVVAHYREGILGRGASVAFTCEARDCGRSTSWANSVFGVKELVAPDSSQFYLAATLGRELLSVYVVQRGNRRIYVHVDVAEAERAVGSDADVPLVRQLRDDGFVIVAGATPAADGSLDVGALEAVDAVAAQIAPLAIETLYVVCHLADSGSTEAALARSAACAETVVQRLRTADITAYGFGGGPLLPRADAPGRRIELVMPSAAH